MAILASVELGSRAQLAVDLKEIRREGNMLHKTSKLLGYHILASDGEIGHVDDFLVDERLGTRYLVVDTSNWIGGKSILVSPSTVDRVDSPNQQIFVRLTREQIEHSPSLDSANIELIETLPPVLIL